MSLSRLPSRCGQWLLQRCPAMMVLAAGRQIMGSMHVGCAPSAERIPRNACIPRQEVVLGKPADFPEYGWDNEYGERKFSLR